MVVAVPIFKAPAAAEFIAPPALIVSPEPLRLPKVVKFPLLSTLNLVQPEAEAVIKSPMPSLLTTKEANEVFPETEATTIVPAPKTLPVTLNLAETVDWEPNKKSAVELIGVITPPVVPPEVKFQ